MKKTFLLCTSVFLYATSYGIAVQAQSRPAPWIEPTQSTPLPVSGMRPVPGPVYEVPAFSRAVELGTRTRTGMPGGNAWVQHARYSIDARIDPASNRLTGKEHVTYINQSPNALNQIRVYLRQNAFAPASPRRETVIPTDGMTLTRVEAAGQAAQPFMRGARNGLGAAGIAGAPGNARSRAGAPGNAASANTYRIDATVMTIALSEPVAAHDSIELSFDWSYTVPLTPSDGRQGRDDHLYFMGYWYPQIGVYDDVNGWVTDPYLLEAEFYMDPADYDVRVTAPRGWLVGATGTLQNAAAILKPAIRAKLADARRTGSVITIAHPGAEAAAAFSGTSSEITWRFKATNVRDFAWGTSNQYVWDATRALVGTNHDTVDINSFYRISSAAAAWAAGGARYTRDAVQQHSSYLWPYPWPVMSSMEGVLTSGGMEYPMMTLMQPWADTLSLAGDLMHETGHMWFPMQVGSNETRYPWMDEGFTQFNTAQSMRALYGEPRAGGRPNDSEPGQRRQYTQRARAGEDQMLMLPGDMFPQDLYNVMYYNKTSQVLAALRGILGEEVFHRAFREYGRRWLNRHPYPYDFFNTIEDVSKRDLGWFWSTWFFQPWSLDQAIGAVTMQGDALIVTIEDRGLAPMPVPVTITRSGGATERIDVPVDTWLTGKRTYSLSVPRGADVVRVEIDAAGEFPDIDRSNQVWIKK